MTVEGICPDRYEPLRTAFEAAFDAGLESGASVAVAERGRARRRPVGRRGRRRDRATVGARTPSSTCGRRPRP